MAEIALVGRAPGRYNLYLGGTVAGTRLNREYRSSVRSEDLIDELRPVLARWKDERLSRERLGDWVERVLWQETPASPVSA
jgi:sulfite reductase (NADPH) hemoprotein beta-component